MKKRYLLGTMILSASLLLGACTNNEPYTAEEEQKLLTEFITEDIATADTLSFKARMDEELDKLSIAASSDLIDAWLYTLYSKVTELNTQIAGFQTDLKALEEEGIDVTKKANVSKVKDKVLNAYLEEVFKYEVQLKSEGDEYYVEPNFKAIIEEYKTYMREDMLAYVELSLEETEKPFFDEKKKTFDLSVIAERILTLESMLDKYPKSVYLDSFKQTQVYYYQLYFGMNNAMLMNKEGKAYLEEVVNTYKIHVDTYKDTTFAKDLAKVLKVIESTGGTLSSELTTTLSEIVKERSPEAWVESSEEKDAEKSTEKSESDTSSK